MAHIKKFYFTYGTNHTDKDGNSLGQCYTIINAQDMDEARQVMFTVRGAKWAFSYDSPQAAGVSRFSLTEKLLEDVRIPTDPEKKLYTIQIKARVQFRCKNFYDAKEYVKKSWEWGVNNVIKPVHENPIQWEPEIKAVED